MKFSPTADMLQSGIAVFLWLILLVLALKSAWEPAVKGVLPTRLKSYHLFRAYIIILLAALIAWRAPELNFNQQYDPDESAFLAAAQRLPNDVVGWRFCDVGTCGPLCVYILGWASLLGMPITYFVGRVTDIACVFATLFFLLKSIRMMAGRRQALLIHFSAASFYLLAWRFDFVHYSGEDLSVALLAAAGWLILVLYWKPGRVAALGVGILLGAVPFTKLQAAPFAVYFYLVTIAILAARLKKRGTLVRDGLPLAGASVMGVLLIPGIIMLPVVLTGNWSEFWLRYIYNAFSYGPDKMVQYSNTYSEIISIFLECMNPFLSGLIEFSALAIVLKRLLNISNPERSWFAGLSILLGYLFIAVAVILKPHTPFTHYALLLVSPAVLVAAWSMRGLLRGAQHGILSRYPWAVSALFLIFSIMPQAIDYPRHFHERHKLSDRPEADAVAAAVKALSKPGDTLAVWGFAPEYFIETGLPSATRNVDTFSTTMPGKKNDFYREDYLSDLEQSKPAIFIDATGGGLLSIDVYGWLHPLEKSRYTMYPPLNEYIKAHYHLQSEVLPPKGTLPVLIFVRNN